MTTITPPASPSATPSVQDVFEAALTRGEDPREALLLALERLDTESRENRGTALHLSCPDWCTDDKERHGKWRAFGEPGHLDALVNDHTGPRFGPFACVGELDALTGRVVAWVGFDEVEAKGLNETDDPELLRQLAADAIAAAEWLEANMSEAQR